MSASLHDLHRIGAKLFFANAPTGGESLPPASELLPVLYDWVRRGAVDGLLIDVADYDHLSGGPGLVVVAHEGTFRLDLGAARPGLSYWRTRPLPGSPAERLCRVCRILLEAARVLEAEPSLRGRVRLSGEDLEVVANDRLAAPNDLESWQAWRPIIEELIGEMYGEERCEIAWNPDPRERLAVTVRAPRAAPVSSLLERMASTGRAPVLEQS